MASLITNLFSPKAPKVKAAPKPKPPPPPAKPSNEEVGKAGEDEEKIRRRRGRGQTLLTGAGLLDGDQAPIISRAKLGDR